MSVNTMNSLLFRSKILKWYFYNKRDLPWRCTSNPYSIWLSEVILQQTRISQGVNYYNKLLERFPDVNKLAEANEDEVLKLWQGLGYYSRARNLHAGAKQIVENCNSVFPNSFKKLKMVKGIGDYTAAAIASIAYNEKVSAIDGNVFRVLSRIYNIDTPINTGAGKTEFKNLSEKLIDDDNPGDYNQAVMEFGALQCKPKNPDCAICIFNTNCLAFQLDKVGELPVKKGKTKVRNRYFYYLMIDDGGYIYFNKRTQKDIWQNMYDFPLIELDTKRNVEEVIGSEKWNEIFSQGDIEIKSISKELVHQLSHQRIFIRFIHVLLKSEKFLNSNFIKIDKRNIFELAVPKVIDTYLLKMWA